MEQLLLYLVTMATPKIKFQSIPLGMPMPVKPKELSLLRQTMSKQHSIHGEFGEVYESLGGQAHLKEWADENPTDFYRMFASMAPKPVQHKHEGELKISLSLQRNDALDGDHIPGEHEQIEGEYEDLT